MKPILFLLALISCSLPAFAQTKPVLYVKLSKVLDSLALADHYMRKITTTGAASDSSQARLLAEQQAFCARHQSVLEGIVKKYGFPGFEEVGEKSSTHFVHLVQHADANPNFQRRVLRLMAAHLKRNNASPPTYAYLAGRVAEKSGRRSTALR